MKQPGARISRRSVLSVPALATLAACSLPTGPEDARNDPDIPPQEWIESLMAVSGTPGLSLAFGDRDEPTTEWYLGVCNAEQETAVSSETLFQAASISKLVFAYGVLLLADRGDIDLKRPLVEYLRPDYFPADERLDDITAEDVLSHRSGLPNWIEDGQADGGPIVSHPGRFRYSGEGYFWLQLVVERISGQGLNAFMHSILFEPGGMSESRFVWDSTLGDRVAFGHEQGRVAADQGLRNVLSMVEPLAVEWNKPLAEWTHRDWLNAATNLDPGREHTKITFQNAAASLVITARDLYTFLRLLSASSDLDGPYLADDLRARMTRPLVQVIPGAGLWWGLGCALEKRTDGRRLVGHEGNNFSFRAYAGIEPETGRSLVVLTNGDGGNGVYERIVRRFLGADQLSFIANLNPNHEVA
ncbi:MAG: beta-lactamase family protein [Gammaproteobacteria bacterium]|nr:beta-lactamase family protein [Gammaproteobacteria bacterium]